MNDTQLADAQQEVARLQAQLKYAKRAVDTIAQGQQAMQVYSAWHKLDTRDGVDNNAPLCVQIAQDALAKMGGRDDTR